MVSFQIMECYLIGDYRSFGRSTLPLSSRSILKPLKNKLVVSAFWRFCTWSLSECHF